MLLLPGNGSAGGRGEAAVPEPFFLWRVSHDAERHVFAETDVSHVPFRLECRSEPDGAPIVLQRREEVSSAFFLPFLPRRQGEACAGAPPVVEAVHLLRRPLTPIIFYKFSSLNISSSFCIFRTARSRI